MTVFLSMLLHVAIRILLRDLILCSANAAFVLLIVEVNFIPSTLQKILKSPANSVLQSTTFFGLLFSVNLLETVLTISFESFVFLHLASTVLSSKCWQKSIHFKPLLSFASLSTYVTSIHQISLLNLVESLLFWKFRVACVELEYEDFKCKNPLPLAVDTM